MVYVFLILGLVTTIAFLCKRTANVTLNTAILKCFASVGFISTAVFAFIENDKFPALSGACIIIGTVFGLIGDFVLDLKYVYKNDADKFLRFGFTSFSLGHVFYAIAVIYMFGLKIESLVIAAVCIALFALFVPFSQKKLNVKYGRFMKITVMYLMAIGFTAGLSFGYFYTDTSKYTWLFNTAMVLFLLSDALLSNLYFSTREKDRSNRVVIVLNHLFYYAAQYIIASTILLYEG